MTDYQTEDFQTGNDYHHKDNIQKFTSYYSTYKSNGSVEEHEDVYEALLKVSFFG
jgi:hypothetical protein